MTCRRIVRDLCPTLVVIFAISCELGDGLTTSDPQPATIERNASALLPADPPSERTMGGESGTELPGSDARFAETEARDSVAFTPSEESGTGPQTWLDHVADLEPVGREGHELRKLAILHPDAEVRKAALEELAEADHPLALKSLVTSLEDDDLEVVFMAIEELESLDERAAIDPLERLARTHEDEEIQEAALKAIEFIE